MWGLIGFFLAILGLILGILSALNPGKSPVKREDFTLGKYIILRLLAYLTPVIFFYLIFLFGVYILLK